jgi:hypothetical protein
MLISDLKEYFHTGDRKVFDCRKLGFSGNLDKQFFRLSFFNALSLKCSFRSQISSKLAPSKDFLHEKTKFTYTKAKN